jgi:uncharacterized protein YutE (UPF0331/DUF86 family)
LDIVLVEEAEKPEEPKYPSPKSIRAALKDADDLFQRGKLAPALMLATSAMEAAAKRAISKMEGREAFRFSTSDLIKSLAFHGFVTDEEFERIRRAVMRRNQIAHGRLKRPVPLNMFHDVKNVTDRLLTQREAEVA